MQPDIDHISHRRNFRLKLLHIQTFKPILCRVIYQHIWLFFLSVLLKPKIYIAAHAQYQYNPNKPAGDVLFMGPGHFNCRKTACVSQFFYTGYNSRVTNYHYLRYQLQIFYVFHLIVGVSSCFIPELTVNVCSEMSKVWNFPAQVGKSTQYCNKYSHLICC